MIRPNSTFCLWRVPDDPVLGRIIRTAPVTGKTGGTGFQIPVAPVLACSTQLGAPRPERKKGGLRKIEGDADAYPVLSWCGEGRKTEIDA